MWRLCGDALRRRSSWRSHARSRQFEPIAMLLCQRRERRVALMTPCAGLNVTSRKKFPSIREFFLASREFAFIYLFRDALARAYGPSWLCNDVTRPFWQSRSSWAGPERELDMVAIQRRAPAPCSDLLTRQIREARGTGGRGI